MSLGMQLKAGYLVGTGAAQNVELGWIPDVVIVINQTDGDKITVGQLGQKVIPFSGGGTTEISAGDTIIGATSGATAVVSEVLLASGSWAGADAAGFFVCHVDDIVGTFGSENVYVGSGSDDATVTVQVEENVDVDTEVAAATGNAAISSYVGVAGSNAKGFTIGSTVSEDNDLLSYIAFRNG